jgi:purine-binding chemotaxis protein CheW
MTDDLLPPPELGGGLPLPDWLTDGGLPDLPDPFAAAGGARPEPLPAVTPPPRKLPEPGSGPLRVPARVAVEEGGRTVCFRTAVTPPLGGWDDVRVVFRLPAGIKSAQVNRKPKVSAGQVVWSLGRLIAGSSVPLIVRVPNGPHLTPALSTPPAFEIAFTQWIGPDLVVSLGGPARVSAGADFVLRVTVDNHGLAADDGVTVTVTRVDAPERPSTRGIGRVEPGWAADADVRLTAPTAEGPCRWTVRVTSADHTSTHTFDADVSTPLAVGATGPASFDLDDVVPFRVTVTNPSVRPRRDVAVAITVPPELGYDSSDGEYRREAGQVEWRIAELDPGESRTVTAWLKGHLPGPTRVLAEATSEDGTSSATVGSVCDLGRAEPASDLLELMRELDPGAATDLSDAATPAAAGERHVLFRMGEAVYAAPITQLREVIRPPAVTPVPGAPDWLVGLANVRGDALSIVDLPTALGLEAAGGRKSVLVSQTADGQTAVGLAVDEVIGIRRLTPTRWSPDDALDAGRVGEFLTGLCDHRDHLTPVLDLDRALRSDTLAAFGAA